MQFEVIFQGQGHKFKVTKTFIFNTCSCAMRCYILNHSPKMCLYFKVKVMVSRSPSVSLIHKFNFVLHFIFTRSVVGIWVCISSSLRLFFLYIPNHMNKIRFFKIM